MIKPPLCEFRRWGLTHLLSGQLRDIYVVPSPLQCTLSTAKFCSYWAYRVHSPSLISVTFLVQISSPKLFVSLYAEASASTPDSGRLTHVGPTGKASMVDVGDKKETMRGAIATGRVALGAEAFTAVRDNILGKGDVLGVARMAGIMAAKQTSSLIPLCHSLNLDRCTIPAFKSQVRLGQCSHVCVFLSAMCLFECSTGEWLLTSCLSDIVSHRGSHDARSMLTIKL